MATLTDARRREQVHSNPELLIGRRIRCPRCLNVADILAYFVFERPARFEQQLNVVFKCRAKVRNRTSGRIETCRCVFSVASDLLPEIHDDAHEAAA